jgi:hypothetical protein
MAFFRAAFWAIAFIVRQVRRRRARRRPPHLVAEMLKTPYWGGIELPVLIRNTGRAAVRDCRYCRHQRFEMDRGPKGSPVEAVVWYATDSFDVALDESGTRQTAFATSDAWPQIVLSDVLTSAAQESRFLAVLVCRDRFGTCYRFKIVDGQEIAMDRWSQPFLNGVIGRAPPRWTKWLEACERIETRVWAASFE